MMNRVKVFLAAASLICTGLLCGCRNSLKVFAPAAPENMVNVSFNTGFSASKNAEESTFMPSAVNSSTFTQYTLSGKYTGDVSYQSGISIDSVAFASIDELNSYTAQLVEGEWDFILYASTNLNGTVCENVYKAETSKTISKDDYIVSFDLQPDTDSSVNGELDLSLWFTEDNVTDIEYKYYRIEDAASSELFSSEEFTLVTADTTVEGYSKISADTQVVPAGEYILVMNLKDVVGEKTFFMGQYSVYFKVQAGLATKIEKHFRDLHTVWTLTLDCNNSDASLPESISSTINFTECNDVNLPLKSTFKTTPTGKYFNGWNTEKDGSGTGYSSGWTAGAVNSNIILYAQWNDLPSYTLKYCDVNKSGFSGTMTQTVTSSGTSLTAGSFTISETPTFNTEGLTLTAADTGHLPAFAGWYTDSAGTNAVSESGGTYTLTLDSSSPDSLTHSDEDFTVTLYAKWNYSVVYVDPVNAADDSSTGFTKACAVKTLAEAKRLLCDDSASDVIYVMSSISESDDLTELGNSTTGFICKNQADYTGSLISITAASDVSIENIVLDGGYDGSTAAKTSPLIYVSSDSAVINLKLTNCTIQNHYGDDGAVYFSAYDDTENSDTSALIISGCNFTNNKVSGSSSTSYLDVYSKNAVNLSGTNIFTSTYDTSTPDIYVTGSKGIITAADKLYVQNGIHMTQNYPIVVDSSLACVGEEYTSIAVIIPNIYVDTYKVLQGATSTQIGYFSLSDAAYYISASGIICSKYKGSGDTTNPYAVTISFAADASTFTTADSITFTAKDADGNPIGVSDWSITVLYYSVYDVPLSLSLTEGASSQTINLANAGIKYAGTYMFTVSGTYNGVQFSSDIQVTVE